MVKIITDKNIFKNELFKIGSKICYKYDKSHDSVYIHLKLTSIIAYN